MKKILLSIFLAASMFLTNINVIAEESASAKYEEAINILSAMNVISVIEGNNDFSADVYVTREEFCIYLSRAFKIETSNETHGFTDVTEDSDLAQHIYALYKRGVVSGYGGEFRPKDIITYNEAIKMLVSMLNYDYAAQLGGYPAGYKNIASTIGITEKVYEANLITKGAAAQLIYNALNVPLMEFVGIKGNELILKSNSDKTMFTELYDIYEGKGIVLANAVSAFITPDKEIEEGEVLIGDTVYKVGKSNVDKLLGHSIEFYYVELDEDEYEIFAIHKDNNEEFILNSDQILDFEKNTYRYKDADGKTKKVRLNDDFMIMYNFSYPVSNFNAEMMTPDIGRVKLIKKGTSGYSAVIIEEYENHIVAGIDENTEVIYFKDQTEVNVGREDCNIYDASGKELKLSSVKEWNVASVLTNSAGKVAAIYVSDEEVEGKVTYKGNVDKPKLSISYDTYNLDPEMLSDIKLGEEAVFYLDYCGNVAGKKTMVSSDLRYAYLLKTKMDRFYGENFEERVVVTLFDQDGTEKKYHVAEKVMINDVLYKKNPQAVIDSGLVSSVNLIKYKLDKNGEISTVYMYDKTSDKYIREIFSGKGYWNLKQRRFHPDQNTSIPTTNTMATMLSSVPVFVVPQGEEYGVEDYKVLGLSTFTNDRTDVVKVYTFGDNVFGEVIVKDSAAGQGYNRPASVVRKIIHKLDEYGDPCTLVSVFYNGEEREYPLTEKINYTNEKDNFIEVSLTTEEVLEHIEVGDILKISVNHQDKIQGFLHIYDTSKSEYLASTNPSKDDYRAEHRFYYGYAYDVTEGLLRYCKELPADKNTKPETENALLGGGFRIYIIDGPEIYIGNENDLKGYTSVGNNCSKIIVHTQYADPEDIFIIK